MSHGEQSDCVLPSGCTKPEECGKAGHCLGNGEGSETSTPASDAALRILQLTKALEQSVRVVRAWHAMPQKPGDDDAFDLYFNHSPEMKLIRDALGKMPDPTEDEHG